MDFTLEQHGGHTDSEGCRCGGPYCSSPEQHRNLIDLQIPPTKDAGESICIAVKYLPLLRRSLRRIRNGDTDDLIIADGGDEAVIACAMFEKRLCPICHDETNVVSLKRFDFEAGYPEIWGVYCDACRRAHHDAVETYIEENIGSVLSSSL